MESIVTRVSELISRLSEKEKDILTKRFGLNSTQVMTLAAIGDEYKVTRERVRQIQSYVVSKMQKSANMPEISEFHVWLNDTLQKHGGLISEQKMNDLLLEKFPNFAESLPELRLACLFTDKVIWEHNKVDFESHFRFASIPFENIETVSKAAIDYLRGVNDAVSPNVLSGNIAERLSTGRIKFSKNLILSIVSIDRRITVGEVGISLTQWRHVNPRTLFDKILYVLNEGKEPLHFSDVAEKIRKLHFDEKIVSVQAVHNELINNPLFVLIGRGIYALKTWGYKDGTVSDVIESLLEKKGPMSVADLTLEVLQRRKVKPVTVQINLNSRKGKFRRNKYGLYELVS